MNQLSLGLFGIVFLGIIIAMILNSWLLKALEPRKSFQRMFLYFVLVLAVGLLLTILFSFIILKLLVVHK